MLIGLCIGVLAGLFLATPALIAISVVCVIGILTQLDPCGRFCDFVVENLVLGIVANLVMWTTHFIVTMPAAWKEATWTFVFTYVLR